MTMQLDYPSRRKATKILALGTVVISAVDILQAVAFIPLYVNYFGERIYGLWIGSGGIIAALTFVDMGSGNLIVQRIAKAYGEKNFKSISTYFSTGLLLHLVLMFSLAIISAILGNNLEHIFKFETTAELREIQNAYCFAVISLIIMLVNNIIEGCMQSLQLPLFGRILNVLSAIFGATLTFYLMITGSGVVSIPIGMAARSLISLIPNSVYIYFLFLRNNLRILDFDKTILKELTTLSFTQLISSLGGAVVNNIEPVLINIFISPQMAVFFSVTKKVGSLIRSTLDKVGGILFPSVAHMHASESKSQFTSFFVKFFQIIVPFSFMLFMVGALLNKNFIALWINESQYLGGLVNWTISLALFVSFIMAISLYLLAAIGDVFFINIMSLIESGIKVILIFIFLKYFGVVGLPLALLCSSAIMVVVVLKRWIKHLDITGEQQIVLVKSVFCGIILTCITCAFLFILMEHLGNLNIYYFVLFSILVFVVNLIGFIISNPLARVLIVAKFAKLFSQKLQ